jgi:predicted alpha/beta superfamily hydrolase
VASDSGIAPRVGGSAAFRAFIRDELMPEVRRRYRTTTETAIVGESLAGLFILETFFREPGLFRHYIVLSPSVWWNDRELVRTAGRLLARGNFRGRALFLSAANEEDIATGTAAIADTLRSRASPGLTTTYRPRPDLEHSTIYRGEGPNALKAVLR